MARIALLMSLLLLSACAGAVDAGAPATGKAGPEAAAVDSSCRTDADCEIKNVGNCCGYYPACVNRDSPTFPGRVQAECEREGRMSICGFPELSGCRCVQGRCEGIRDGGGVQLR